MPQKKTKKTEVSEPKKEQRLSLQAFDREFLPSGSGVVVKQEPVGTGAAVGASKSNFRLFTHLIEFGQGGGACLVISILRQVGMGKLFHVMRTCRVNRNLVVSLFCNKGTASMIWTSMDMNPVVPALTLNVLSDKAEDLRSFEGMSYTAKADTGGCVHDVGVFEPVQLDVKWKIPFRFLDHGDVSVELDQSNLKEMFQSYGIEVFSYRFYGISPARGDVSHAVVLTLDACLGIDTFNANTGALSLLANPLDVPSNHSICKIQLAVTVARESPDVMRILSVEPVHGSMELFPNGVDDFIDSLPGRAHYKTKTVKWGWFQESVREMLSGSAIPAEKRIVLAYTPLSNLIGNGFKDFEVGTVAVLTVGQSERNDDFSVQSVDKDPRDQTSFLVYIRGHKPNGRIHIQVIRYEQACWVACVIYGRPAIISSSENRTFIHFMGISNMLDPKILRVEGGVLVNALVRSDFRSNWDSVVVPALTSRTSDPKSLCNILRSTEVIEGLLEMVLIDTPSVWSIFEDDGFHQNSVTAFALRCVRIDDDLYRSFASRLIQTGVDLDSFVNVIIALVETSVDVNIIVSLMGKYCKDQFRYMFHAMMDLFLGQQLHTFSVRCDDAVFDRLLICLQKCCPHTVFPLACRLMELETFPQTAVQRITTMLRWSFDTYPGINRGNIDLDKCRELALKVFTKNKELCRVWNDHFHVIDMDMDELSCELVSATPLFVKFLERFERIRAQLPDVKKMVAKMQAIAAKRDAATDGGGGSTKSGLQADLGTVQYGTRGASMSVNVLAELADQLNTLSQEFVPVDAPRAARVALVPADGGQEEEEQDQEMYDGPNYDEE